MGNNTTSNTKLDLPNFSEDFEKIKNLDFHKTNVSSASALNESNNGWIDKAKILSKEEFIAKLKANK